MNNPNDEEAFARFAHLRDAIDVVLNKVCPDGYRLLVVIAEPDQKICLMTDWADPLDQLEVLRILAERLIHKIGQDPGGGVPTAPIH